MEVDDSNLTDEPLNNDLFGKTMLESEGKIQKETFVRTTKTPVPSNNGIANDECDLETHSMEVDDIGEEVGLSCIETNEATMNELPANETDQEHMELDDADASLKARNDMMEPENESKEIKKKPVAIKIGSSDSIFLCSGDSLPEPSEDIKSVEEEAENGTFISIDSNEEDELLEDTCDKCESNGIIALDLTEDDKEEEPVKKQIYLREEEISVANYEEIKQSDDCDVEGIVELADGDQIELNDNSLQGDSDKSFKIVDHKYEESVVEEIDDGENLDKLEAVLKEISEETAIIEEVVEKNKESNDEQKKQNCESNFLTESSCIPEDDEKNSDGSIDKARTQNEEIGNKTDNVEEIEISQMEQSKKVEIDEETEKYAIAKKVEIVGEIEICDEVVSEQMSEVVKKSDDEIDEKSKELMDVINLSDDIVILENTSEEVESGLKAASICYVDEGVIVNNNKSFLSEEKKTNDKEDEEKDAEKTKSIFAEESCKEKEQVIEKMEESSKDQREIADGGESKNDETDIDENNEESKEDEKVNADTQIIEIEQNKVIPELEISKKKQDIEETPEKDSALKSRSLVVEYLIQEDDDNDVTNNETVEHGEKKKSKLDDNILVLDDDVDMEAIQEKKQDMDIHQIDKRESIVEITDDDSDNKMELDQKQEKGEKRKIVEENRHVESKSELMVKKTEIENSKKAKEDLTVIEIDDDDDESSLSQRSSTPIVPKISNIPETTILEQSKVATTTETVLETSNVNTEMSEKVNIESKDDLPQNVALPMDTSEPVNKTETLPSNDAPTYIDVFKNKECINYECARKNIKYYRAPMFALNFFNVNKRKKMQFICGDCYESSVQKYEEYAALLVGQKPLYDLKQENDVTDCVEIIDSSDEEDNATEKGEQKEAPLPTDVLNLIEIEFDSCLKSVFEKVNIRQQLSWCKASLEERAKRLENANEAIDVELKNMQKNADNIQQALSQYPKQKIHMLPPLCLNDFNPTIMVN